MRYTFRQLEYFIAAGESGSITQASERVHISPPSISTAIAHLEKELGVKLFIRHHAQGLSLTPVGRDLLREAKKLIAQAEGLYAVASESDGQVRGRLSVGCMVTLAPMIAPELSHSFEAAFPATQIHHIEADQEQLLEGLRRSEIDLAITYDLDIPGDILFSPLAELPPHVVLSEAHPLAKHAALTLKDLESEPLILLDLPLSREYFLGLFMKEGVTPLIGRRSAHQEVVRTMVANGYGYSLFNVRPRSDFALDGRRLVRVRLAGDHRPMVVGTAIPKELQPSRLIRAFEAHCRSFISDSYISGMIAPHFERREKRG
ncbi:LysR family transcriptional regulator [Enterovirga aerilata]|uniref:LysR family transcriptional regulator n=1 Tax=Enterovirga aerilata TaxID=2730920 RepID=A0A849I6W5_9HYPH|nr:LysR family transcriptional regulator [Enterovirga sp. DB1703]NNM71777.1 LysR family transcriptional regulator [Enterovirga sp. DB1703]